MTDSTSMTTFMKRLLEPLPAEDLVDTQYNSLLRRARNDVWRKADAKTGYFRAKLNWERAQSHYRYWFEGVETPFCRDKEIVADLRKAIAEQMLVPAPDKASVHWKKTTLSVQFRFLPIEAAQLEKAIADDEVWLAAHPAKRARRAPEA